MASSIIQSSPAPTGLFDGLASQPADALLALIGDFRRDERPQKIDVGVGVYRDDSGATPVLAAIRAAEQRLLTEQVTKSYLGPEGDVGFTQRIAGLVLDVDALGSRLGGLQTPGGTGALRLAAELVKTARPNGRILVGTPTWPNHGAIFAASGLEVVTYPYFDVAGQTVLFDRMMGAFEVAVAGDVVLLHGCCHNPLGADLDAAQWHAVAEVIARRRLVPLIDLAYHGLARGLDEDAAGVGIVLAQAEEALLAYSCDKNFGMYRERVGALFAISGDARRAAVTQSNLLALARANWSMPPDHGAAAVRLVLEDDALTAVWRAELDGMRNRIATVRRDLVACDPWFAPLERQLGMFSTLPLHPAQIADLREQHGVYMAGSGRINLAGLTSATIAPFAAAVAAVR